MSISFFSLLKHKGKFHWNTNSEQAFIELKRYLIQVPLFSSRQVGDELLLYLATTPTGSKGCILCRIILYYISKALTEAKLKYSRIEKLIVALQQQHKYSTFISTPTSWRYKVPITPQSSRTLSTRHVGTVVYRVRLVRYASCLPNSYQKSSHSRCHSWFDTTSITTNNVTL